MKYLFPPPDKVDLYNEGFGTNDLLNRKPTGKSLSGLFERIDEPIVMALDGAWGSGKSHFLQRWVGSHELENEGTATTIYFDAFANDFLDDPLIALTSEINERLSGKLDASERGLLQKVKTGAAKLARPAFRMTLAAATTGLSEVVGAAANAAIEELAKETKDAADTFWRKEDGRRAAMVEFRSALTQLTEPATDGSDGRRLIIVIDELDRCRPDYALAILEVIKHFFSVPRVHFILGVNLKALEHIVRARYGVGIDAADYLKRFISLSMRLPEIVDGRDLTVQIKYFSKLANEMGLDQSLTQNAHRHLQLAAGPAGISLRDIEKILTRLALLSNDLVVHAQREGWTGVLSSLVLFQVMDPELFEAATKRTITLEAIDKFYGIDPKNLPQITERLGWDVSYIREILSQIFTIDADAGEGRETYQDNRYRSSSAQVLLALDIAFFNLYASPP